MFFFNTKWIIIHFNTVIYTIIFIGKYFYKRMFNKTLQLTWPYICWSKQLSLQCLFLENEYAVTVYKYFISFITQLNFNQWSQTKNYRLIS